MNNNTWIHRFALIGSGLTLVLLAVGALVTSTGSGLAVPDWPLSFGQFFPPMVGGVLFEHGHRLIAGGVALYTFFLTVTVFRLEKRAWVKKLALAMVVVVLIQAGLGGLTVLLKLPAVVSVFHACLGQTFFCLMVTLAFVTSPTWFRTESLIPSRSSVPRLAALPGFALVVTGIFFTQLVLGAFTRHLGAGLAIPDFPTVFGGLVPPEFNLPIAFHYAHRLGAFVVLATVIAMTMAVYRRYLSELDLVAISGVLITLVAIQGMLGAMVIWMRRPVWLTSTHLVVGALALATSLIFTIHLFHKRFVSRRARIA